MPSEDYIKTSEMAIQDILYTTLYNISFLLQDTEGKIPDKEAKLITRNLVVSPTGSITGLGGVLALSQDSLLGQEVFNPLLSDYGFDLYNRITSLDKSVVFKSNYGSQPQVSVMLSGTEGLPRYASSYMSYLYLELYSLLTSVVQYRAGGVFKMTLEEIDVIVKNSRYIGAKIGTVGNQQAVYKILNVLKHVQRSILFVRKSIPLILR